MLTDFLAFWMERHANGTHRLVFFCAQDGVYPEKVNKSRVGVNNNMRSIGKNVNPVQTKFTGVLGPFEL